MPLLGLFDVAVVGNACQLRVSGNIDREASGQYIIVIGVREEARRTKRQATNQQTPYGKGVKNIVNKLTCSSFPLVHKY